MERPRPKNISLPSVRSILDETNMKSGAFESSKRNNDLYFSAGAPRTAPLSFYQFNIATPTKASRAEFQEDRPATPKQRGVNDQHVYPSPASDNLSSDIEMGDGPLWSEAAKTPLFKVDESASQSSGTTERQTTTSSNNAGVHLTPSIVHYRPNGIPSTRNSRKSSVTDRRGSNSQPNELKIRMVKWDRITDKGTAPLNVETRPTGPRSCTLCYLTKRRVSPFQKSKLINIV
jgi:hypothetical protein